MDFYGTYVLTPNPENLLLESFAPNVVLGVWKDEEEQDSAEEQQMDRNWPINKVWTAKEAVVYKSLRQIRLHSIS